MEKVISDNQSVFMPVRLITDNVIITHELLHSMRQKRKAKKRYMAKKAYDIIEWNFLESVMPRVGF